MELPIKKIELFLFRVVPGNYLYQRVDDILINLDQLSAVPHTCSCKRSWCFNKKILFLSLLIWGKILEHSFI